MENIVKWPSGKTITKAWGQFLKEGEHLPVPEGKSVHKYILRESAWYIFCILKLDNILCRY